MIGMKHCCNNSPTCCDRPRPQSPCMPDMKKKCGVTFDNIFIPANLGGSKPGDPYAPENGAYTNALVQYELDGGTFIYDSDGIFFPIANAVLSVNGKTGAVVIDSTITPATTTTLGGIIVGDNLTITEDGTLSANATSIVVDDALSTSSTNPVQNQVITNALNNKLDNTSVIVYSGENVLAATWVSDTTYQDEGYNYKANIPLSGVTAQYRPSVTFALSDAESGNFAPISESYAGGVAIYAKTAPTETMTIPSIMCVEEA